jgi:hypothetical protein
MFVIEIKVHLSQTSAAFPTRLDTLFMDFVKSLHISCLSNVLAMNTLVGDVRINFATSLKQLQG